MDWSEARMENRCWNPLELVDTLVLRRTCLAALLLSLERMVAPIFDDPPLISLSAKLESSERVSAC